ncbi:MAG: M56 family metallopeptidase [Gemmataceae bacterium]
MSNLLLSAAAHNTLLAAALAAVAALVGYAAPRRPALAHALWLLVLLKLITPPLVGLPVWPGDPPLPAIASCPAPLGPAEPALAPAPPPPSWDRADLAVLAVAGGALAYWGLAGWRLIRLRRLLAGLPDAGLDGYVADLAGRFSVTAPRVVFAAGPLPPLLAAVVGRPVLVLPAELWARLDEAQRRALVLHELAHLARGDHVVRRVELVVLGLCWWNPLAWLAARQLRRVEERCCDAWVVWACPDDAPAYASALVETLAFLAARPSCLPAGASGAGPVFDIRRRLTMILNGHTPRRLSPGGLLLVAAAGLALPLTPTRAQTEPPDTAEGLIATVKSCQACHAAPVGQKPGGMKLHDDIVRMMDELRRMRKDVADREAKFAEMLKRFEREAGAPTPPDEVQDLKRKLDRLQKELDDLRRKPAAENGGLSRVYLNQRSFDIPYERGRTFSDLFAGSIRLFVSRDAGLNWEMIARPTTPRFRYTAPEDGEYWFGLTVGDERGPSQPLLRVCVDTVKPDVTFVARVEPSDVLLTYEIRDPNLDPKSPQIEYRTAHGWKKIPTPPGASHGFSHTMKEPGKVWRIRAKDLAGNEVVVEAK